MSYSDSTIDKLKGLSFEQDEDTLVLYLDMAKDKIMRKVYPFGYDEQMDLPSKYENLQIEIALYLLNKRGAEGEIIHNENGINRHYADGDVPESMLRGVYPFCSPIR